jgi:hypothetical protein
MKVPPTAPQPPRTVDLFVSGRWQPPRAGQYEPATSPVTGELTDAVRAAWVNVNESSNYWETHLPFGGGGGSASGVGRVGGRYAMEALSQVRTVVLSGLA